MSRLQKLKNKMIVFMQGRNGIDEILKFCLLMYLLLYIVNIFANSGILFLVMSAVFVYSFFRMMSRDIEKRREENSCFLIFTGKVQRKLSMIKTMLTDKSRVYKKCPGCKRIMRIPAVPGEHTVKCPCGREMKIKIKGKVTVYTKKREGR